MKKSTAILLAAFIILTLCIPAFADVESPHFTAYTAYISNPDGVVCKEKYSADETEYTIPFNTEIAVVNEYEGDSGIICEFQANSIFEDYHLFETSIDNISNNTHDIEYTNMVEINSKYYATTYICINEDGAVMRKGPSSTYDIVGTIPYGTTVTCNYTDGEPINWGYLTYNGISGWANIGQFGGGYDFAEPITEKENKTGKVIVLEKGLRLMKKPADSYDVIFPEDDNYDESAFVGEEIPVGTEFNYNILYEGNWNNFALVEYNGIKGWIPCDCTNLSYRLSTYPTTVDNISYIYTTDSFEIYTEPYSGGKSTGVKIPANSLVSTDLSSKHYCRNDSDEVFFGEVYFDVEEAKDIYIVCTYHISYNGTEGWITESMSYDGIIEIEDFQLCKTETDVKLYTDESKQTVAMAIPAGETLVLFDFSSDKVIYHGKVCWVDYEYGSESDPFNRFYNDENDIDTIIGIITASADGSASSAVTNAFADLDVTDGTAAAAAANWTASGAEGTHSTKSVVITCVCAAAIVALTAVVCIALVNKKKKSSVNANASDDEENSID